MDSLPQIKLTGTGTVTLTVGAYTLEMVDLDPLVPVLIDSEAMTVTNVALSASYISDMTGSFPKLVLGDNVISHTGTVASVVIKPRYRWL
jgi:phage-related protein